MGICATRAEVCGTVQNLSSSALSRPGEGLRGVDKGAADRTVLLARHADDLDVPRDGRIDQRTRYFTNLDN